MVQLLRPVSLEDSRYLIGSTHDEPRDLAAVTVPKRPRVGRLVAPASWARSYETDGAVLCPR